MHRSRVVTAMNFKIYLLIFLLLLSSTSVLAASKGVKNYRQGFAYFKKGQTENAILSWRKALKQRKALSKRQLLKLFLGLSRAYENIGQQQKALKTIAWAKKLAPNNKVVKKAEKRLRGVSVSDALEMLETALLMEKATTGAGLDSFKEAAAAFRKAIKQKKDLSRAHYGLGTCLLYLNDNLAEAEKHLLLSHRMNVSDIECNWRLAQLYKRKKLPAKELEHLNKCLNSGSSTPQLHVALACAYGQRNQPKDHPKILGNAQKSIDFDPSYGHSIVNEVVDEGVKSKILEMIKKAEAAQRERDKKQEKVLIVKYFGSPT